MSEEIKNEALLKINDFRPERLTRKLVKNNRKTNTNRNFMLTITII